MIKTLRLRATTSLWITLAAFLALPACRQTPKTTAPASSAAIAEETSVRPGINDSYMDPDLDVTQWIERFEREGREVFEHRADLVQALGIEPGMDIADIGAGTGLFTTHFAREVGPEGMVYAVDIVPEFLQLIEKRSSDRGFNNVLTVLCTERSVELPENSIDLAFLCDVYHHFEYPLSSLRSIHDALKPGGSLVVIDFKRIPGESSEWILEHVRAGQETVMREIQSAGFQFAREYSLLEDNYMLRFRK